MSPIVLHIPHASKEIPKGVRSTFLPSDEKIERELLLMTDAWTDEIVAYIAFDATGGDISGKSASVVDPGEIFERRRRVDGRARNGRLLHEAVDGGVLCEFSAMPRGEN